MEEKNKTGVPCSPDSNCAAFERVSYSLIEEPEVCEWCTFFDEDNMLCVKGGE